MHKRPISPAQLRQVPKQFSWVDQRLVRERYIDQLSHAACALYLFLVTVADAQGLSYYADPSLCQRLSLTGTALHQARQALITRGLVAYQPPLYQVLALDATPRETPASREAPARASRQAWLTTTPWTSKPCSRASGRCWHDRLSPLLSD